MFASHFSFDSSDNFNQRFSNKSGISSAVKCKNGKSLYLITISQPKPQHRKFRLTKSMRNSKISYCFSKQSQEQKSKRILFEKHRNTFLSLSKNSQINDPYLRNTLNHRRTEERGYLLVQRGRSTEKITPSTRTNRNANSVDKKADLLSWELASESFIGMDFDTYIPIRRLGAGAHGSAYEVLHKSGQMIVTKFFGKKQKKFFRHEAAVLAQLKKISENLTNNTFEFNIEPYFETEYYYCLNFVAGMGTLGDFIDFLCKEKQSLTQIELLFIFEKLCESYLYLVKLNYTHRDIKPANIILDPKDLTPKFIDYSLAACYGGSNEVNEIAGTPAYISPFLQKPLDKAKLILADLYSLGVTMLEVAFPTTNILAYNHTAKRKLAQSKFEMMPVLKKILRTLLSHSKKKFSILKKIFEQKEVLKNEDLDKLLEEPESDSEEAIDSFKLTLNKAQNKNSSLTEKYLQNFIKYLKPNQKNFNEEEKDSDKTADTPKKINELEFQENEEEESGNPLILARRAVKLFNSEDTESKNANEAKLLIEKINTCILELDQSQTEIFLRNNLKFLYEKYEIERGDGHTFQIEEVLLDHSEAIVNLIFRRKNLENANSEFPYQEELITRHPQKLPTNNLKLAIIQNYCLNEFDEMLETLKQQDFINKIKNFVSSNYQLSELLGSTMVSLQGHLHLLITFLDFAGIFLDPSLLSSFPKIRAEANIIEKCKSDLYEKFLKNDITSAMKEIMDYQLFYLMIGAILYYRDQIPKSEKFNYDIEQRIQILSKDCNKDIFLFFQLAPEEIDKFPKIKNLVDLCWEGLEANELIQRYVYKYSSGSSKPQLIGLHLHKRAPFRGLNAWINAQTQRLQNLSDIYLEIEIFIEKDKQKIQKIKESLSGLKNIKKVKLHVVNPFKANDKAKNKEKDEYDEFLSQTLEIISSFEYSLQLEIVFDFAYISPSGLEFLGERISELKKLKMIEMEFSYCPHITDESVKRILLKICSALELELLVFKLFACQKVIHMDSIENVLSIPEIESQSKPNKIDFVCKPYSEHHSRAEVAGVVSQGFSLFL